MFKVLTARLNPPKPSLERFDGLTILLVGSSGGIGLEAAKKLAAQGVSTLVITARDEVKATRTKSTIEQHLSSLFPDATPKPTIVPLVVDMTSAASIHSFVGSLKSHTAHLDHAIISAGVLQRTYEQLETSYEASLQVNAISPTFLSLLLLPLLLASPLTTRPSISERPHLVFVSSGAAWLTSLSSIQSTTNSNTPLRDLSQRGSFPPGPLGGQTQYGRSKLMLEYAFRRVAFLPALADAHNVPQVLVTSVCPGAVSSELSRQWAGSIVFGTITSVMNHLVARTPEQGSNIYISSLSLGSEGRGEMWTDDHIATKECKRNIKTPEGIAFGNRLWSEMKDIVKKMDAEGGKGVVERMLADN